jgi:hypothetical protein
MSNDKTAKSNTLAAAFMGTYLCVTAAIALLSPAGEFPPSPYHLFTLGLDGVMTALLIILVIAVGNAQGGGLRMLALVVGSLGVVAGLIKVGIRFTSDHAWWTGNYLPPVFN